MNELPNKPTAEGVLTQEQIDQYSAWMSDYPAPEVPALRECGPELAELERMFDTFEAEHPLEELLSITNLTPDEAPLHPVRGPAKDALAPMFAALKALRSGTNIAPERRDELNARWRTISQAVGMINNNKVDHTR